MMQLERWFNVLQTPTMPSAKSSNFSKKRVMVPQIALAEQNKRVSLHPYKGVLQVKRHKHFQASVCTLPAGLLASQRVIPPWARPDITS